MQPREHFVAVGSLFRKPESRVDDDHLLGNAGARGERDAFAQLVYIRRDLLIHRRCTYLSTPRVFIRTMAAPRGDGRSQLRLVRYPYSLTGRCACASDASRRMPLLSTGWHAHRAARLILEGIRSALLGRGSAGHRLVARRRRRAESSPSHHATPASPALCIQKLSTVEMLRGRSHPIRVRSPRSTLRRNAVNRRADTGRTY